MQVIVEIPENELAPPDRARQALEAFAIAGYRSGALTPYETRLMLGFGTRDRFNGFLKERGVFDHSMTAEDLEREFAQAREFA